MYTIIYIPFLDKAISIIIATTSSFADEYTHDACSIPYDIYQCQRHHFIHYPLVILHSFGKWTIDR